MSSIVEQQLEQLCRRLGHRFARPEFLQTALTHRSAGSEHNERLEFLGDALLNCVIAAELFRARPDLPEGDLSRMRASLVRESTLAEVAREMDVGPAIRLGPGEGGSQRRASVLADTFEALLGAVYLDAGFETLERVIRQAFAERLENLPDPEMLKDAKTRLQEYLQARSIALPEYEVQSAEGPPHQRRFLVECRVAGLNQVARGEGGSRRKAEQAAAAAVLEKLGHG